MSEKLLGKIESAYFGLGGYQGSMLGIHFSLRCGSYGSGDNNCFWDANLLECSEHCKWTEMDRSKKYDEIMRYISDLLSDAKVDRIEKLKGVPIEAEVEGMQLKSWRVLTEVL